MCIFYEWRLTKFKSEWVMSVLKRQSESVMYSIKFINVTITDEVSMDKLQCTIKVACLIFIDRFITQTWMWRTAYIRIEKSLAWRIDRARKNIFFVALE